MRSLLPQVVLLAVLCAPAVALGNGVYRWVEKDGTVSYSNVNPGGGVRAKRLKGTFTRPPGATAPPKARPASASKYDEVVESAARRYRIPPALVRAVMHAESNFDPMALSHKGASGLMQLMPQTAREMFVKDIFDEHQNIEGGTRYLRVLANEFNGDMVKMVAAYNAGPEAVRKYGGQVPPFEETQAYVRKVLALYFQYKQAGAAAVSTTAEADERG